MPNAQFFPEFLQKGTGAPEEEIKRLEEEIFGEIRFYLERLFKLKKRKYWEVFSELVPELQEALFQKDLYTTAQEMGKGEGVKEDLIEETLDRVFVGLQNPTTIGEYLKGKGVPESSADILERQILKLLNPYKNYLEALYNTSFPVLDLPPEEDKYLEPLS